METKQVKGYEGLYEVIDGQIGDYVYTEETEADAEEKLKQK